MCSAVTTVVPLNKVGRWCSFVNAMTSDSEVRVLVFDTETTGLSESDQLIQLAWGWWDGKGGLTDSNGFKCLPTINWESEWHDKHKLSMADLADFPPLTVAMLESFMDDVNAADYILGYNVDFDISVLERELTRLGQDPTPISKKKFIDPLAIWNKSEGRKLVDAHKRWVGTDLEGAHDADADVTGTVAILPGMLLEFGLNDHSMRELADISREKDYVDRTGKMKWVNGKPVLTCTKYNYFGDGTGSNVPGLNVWEVARRDRWYATNYQGFKKPAQVHQSVCTAFKLAMRNLNDEAEFLTAMMEQFGPPQ